MATLRFLSNSILTEQPKVCLSKMNTTRGLKKMVGIQINMSIHMSDI